MTTQRPSFSIQYLLERDSRNLSTSAIASSSRVNSKLGNCLRLLPTRTDQNGHCRSANKQFYLQPLPATSVFALLTSSLYCTSPTVIFNPNPTSQQKQHSSRSNLSEHPLRTATSPNQEKMAEGQSIPTFKLVLVGDGGTGKVSALLHELNMASKRCARQAKANRHFLQTDNFRQAPLDW
jgi:hypothetical protein